MFFESPCEDPLKGFPRRASERLRLFVLRRRKLLELPFEFLALPRHDLESFARGVGYYQGLPPDIRRRQLDMFADLTAQYYPRLRLYLFDAHRLDDRQTLEEIARVHRETGEVLDMLLAKKRSPDRKRWLEEKGNLAEV